MRQIFDGDVVVVGCGIVGTMTALALQDAGCSVIAVDEAEPGAGTAAGSGGFVHDGEIFPVAHLQLLTELPRLFLDPFGPLVFRISYLPKMLGWSARFVQSMRPSAIERGIEALASLNRLAIEALFSVARSAHADDLLVHRGGLKIAHQRKTFEGFSHELEVLHRAGIPAEPLDATALCALEPALGEGNAGAILFANSAHCVDPRLFGERLADRIRTRGSIVRASAAALQPQIDGTWVVRMRGGASELRARRVVVTAGYSSASLLRPLGYRVPVAPARGYHLMIEDPGVELRHPIIFHEPHVGATPMLSGVRLAGTMEFTAPSAPADYRRAQMLYPIVHRYIPGLRNGRMTQWAGIRPSMPDSLPAIGVAARHENLSYCFGHGHLGFTQAAISARCVAALVTGERAPIDVKPFDLARF